jgi:hypothetical protein
MAPPSVFQCPNVLAFEPTFVEIRNVKTGSMSQVIQGNNLRCLFTDTPPSLQQAYPRMSRSSLSGSLYNGCPGPGPYPYRQQYPGQLPTPQVYPGQLRQQQAPPPPYGRGVGGREEIILVSDDRVLALRMALPGQ